MNPPRFTVAVDPGGLPIVAPAPAKRSRHPAEKETLAGLGRVQLFGRAPGPWVVAWYEREGAPRRRISRSAHKRARKFFDDKVTELTNRAACIRQLNPADAAAFLRCQEKAARLGLSLELVLDRYTEFRRDLPAELTDQDVKKFFLEHRPRGYSPRNVPTIVTDYLAERQDQISPGWYTALEKCLTRFGEAFPGPMHNLRHSDLNAWLRNLKDKLGRPLGTHARHNHRAAVQQLVNWAKANQQLPGAWAELDQVDDPGTRMGAVRIWTPENLLNLLVARQNSEQLGRARKKSLIPFLACQAFAGIRHEELARKEHGDRERLDWRDVHLKERWIYIKPEVSKTRIDRTVPITENLAAWLAPYAKRSGRVCELDNASSALTRAKKNGRLPAGKNQSRNVLRKSWISYRLATIKHIGQVAEEAGNSPGIIRKHYRAVIPHGFGAPAAAGSPAATSGQWPLEPDATRWFSLQPEVADVEPLFAWARGR